MSNINASKPDESDLVSGFKHIVKSAGYMGGRAALLQTRWSVDMILDSLAAGLSREEFERDYGITSEQIDEALFYASKVLESERVAS